MNQPQPILKQEGRKPEKKRPPTREIVGAVFFEKELMREESVGHTAHDLFCRSFKSAKPPRPKEKSA